MIKSHVWWHVSGSFCYSALSVFLFAGDTAVPAVIALDPAQPHRVNLKMSSSSAVTVPQRPMGKQGLVTSAIGLGCMGMTAFYVSDPKAHEADSLATIDRALELGINHLDTAWVYQSAKGDTNEELVGKAIAKHGRDKFVIATKFGIVMKDGGLGYDASPANIRAQLADSLKRLGTDYIDLYYQHRQDPATPIEVVAATLKELVAEGKIRYVGYSEVTPAELRRAHAIHPVTAIQQEWSLSTRDLEKALVPTARELGVAIVAYSPLGRGLLAQRFTTTAELEDGDWRKAGSVPRFSGEHLTKNADAAARLAAIATRLGVPPAQLALAWVHSRGEDVFPIPGTKSAARLEENAGAVALAGRLTKEQIAEIEAAVPEAEGPRYAGNFGTWNSRTSAEEIGAASSSSL